MGQRGTKEVGGRYDLRALAQVETESRTTYAVPLLRLPTYVDFAMGLTAKLVTQRSEEAQTESQHGHPKYLLPALLLQPPTVTSQSPGAAALLVMARTDFCCVHAHSMCVCSPLSSPPHSSLHFATAVDTASATMVARAQKGWNMPLPGRLAPLPPESPSLRGAHPEQQKTSKRGFEAPKRCSSRSVPLSPSQGSLH